MPVFTWDELSNVVAETIDGESSFELWSIADANEWADANGYESWVEAFEDDSLDTPRWRFVIAPADGSNPAAGWTLLDEHWGYPDYDSGYSHSSDAPGFEGVIYPSPGESVSAAEIIDEAMSEGVASYGEVPDVPAY